jgi:hypothetical protein
MILDEKEAPRITGPRVEQIVGATSTVNLVRMCEEVVEDTSKRMRLLETIHGMDFGWDLDSYNAQYGILDPTNTNMSMAYGIGDKNLR